ncbi:Gfo/Idh/MocA family oxidoreductase [Kitasatospora sp. GAS1066B]|uniref:Gfo/Idh/MocA family oxidoreductase n=1 Tax=Kitasatospora sp. GAS1066B TaxID=3156271 RepID=UPI003519A5F9
MPPTSPFAPAAAPRKLAVIGLGLIGVRYLAAAEADPAFALAAACDLGEATPIDPRAVGVPVYRDHRALLAAHHDLGGAIVTGPGGGRAGLCRDLLAAGLPVCVEHPPATEVSDARALAAIAAERSLVLFAAFPRRHDAALLELVAACAGAPIARVKVRHFEEQRDGSGGCLADRGPAAFDLVRLLFGEAELSVVRAAIERDPTGVDRRAVIDLVTAGPTPRRAKVELDRRHPGEVRDVEVTLADGRLLRADLPAGHPGSDTALRPEYQKVLTAFGAAIDAPGSRRDGGLAALDLVAAAYRLDRDTATHVFRQSEFAQQT